MSKSARKFDRKLIWIPWCNASLDCNFENYDKNGRWKAPKLSVGRNLCILEKIFGQKRTSPLLQIEELYCKKKTWTFNIFLQNVSVTLRWQPKWSQEHNLLSSCFSPAPLYLICMVTLYFCTALLHPSEATNIVHGIWYFLCLPSGSLLLAIYSVANLTDKSWGV